MTDFADALRTPPRGGTPPRSPAAPPRPWRRLRLALRVSAWSLALTLVVAGVGVLLFIHRGDAVGSGRVANRELEFLLQAGEQIAGRAPVLQRHWWHHFRVEHGVLAATDRRLLYVGVPPERLLPREPEPLELQESAFPYERPIDAERTRVFFGTLPGVRLLAPGNERTFGVASRDVAKLDAVLQIAGRRQADLRQEAERARQAALADAERVREPLWHQVQRGEALEVVARAYGVTIEQLVEWNRLTGTGIRSGQRLLVKPWT